MREQRPNNFPSNRPDGRPRQERAGRDLSRYDAVHRALLAGLLGNVANKTDIYEYTGARGTKLHVHPGSSQFERKPQWIMAAELVETTKLYARTVAKIQPEWVEHLADHLVKRAYTDPHWNPQTAHVVAYEKVTLYGLTIIPQRTVHYGPIDPKASRDIFIHALVEGEFQTDAPFLRHNQKLIDDIQTLEAKSRQRDVLVSHEVRFDFYNARIPANVYNGPLFEKWRRSVERNSPRILFMSRRDLMMHSASDVTQELFPDHLFIDKLRVPLEYHFEPGHVADGVTATIPLPALNQVPAVRFEWVVPGLLREKLTALIKSLPKQLRVNFVPAPDFAEKAYQFFVDAGRKQGWQSLGPINDALATFLSKQQGITVPPGAFDPTSLLDHLHTNFKIVDEAGKQIAMGRDLNELRRRLGIKVKTTFEQIEHPKFNREDVTEWDFGDLPESVQVQRHGMTLTAYPALAVCDPDPNQPPQRKAAQKVSGLCLRLFDSRDAAAASHAAGLRRLFIAELRDEIRYFSSNIPGIHQMCMHYATLGPCQDLKDDIVGETINRTFLEPDTNVRTQMEFELRKQAGRRHKLLEVGREVATLAGQILEVYHQVALQLNKPSIPAFAAAIQDVRQQLAHLMPKGFLTTTPDAWLVHYPRFLKAVLARVQKLSTAGHTRDATYMAELTPFWTGYVERVKHNRANNVQDPAMEHFRWMLEEFRVSLFAQELKTSMPISAKRLEKQWELVRK